MKNIISASFVILLFAGLFLGCEKKENMTPPVLPPLGTMSIDFSNFETSKKSINPQSGTKKHTALDKSNWILAATTAGVWNIILAVNLAVPVESFKLAINNAPVNIEDSKWEWRSNFTVLGGTYKSRLTGEIRSKDVKWEMYISRAGIGAFSEILWFQGTSMADGKSGQWVLNHSQTFPEPMLQIDWKAAGSGISDIKYTSIRDKKDDRSSDPFKTSFIEYGVTENTLNAFYNIHQNAGELNVFHDAFIVWNTTNHNGHIKAYYYFNDELWHCWSETLDNINCN